MRSRLRGLNAWVRQVPIGTLLRGAAPLLWGLAWIWRRLLVRTTFIAVTGSLGKTTAKEAIAAVLSAKGRVYSTWRNQNGSILVALNVLRVRPWHRFAVIEVATSKPGGMERPARVVQPDIAVILCVARTHTRNYSSIEQIAEEKLSLLKGLRRGGLAVLNGDDVRLAVQASSDQFQVKRFGSSPALDLWADEVSVGWPERLGFRAHAGSEEVRIKTRLLGKQALPSLLSALLVGRERGVNLASSAERLSQMTPFDARMQPVGLPSGAVVIRDEYNGSEDALQPALDVLEQSQAKRKILILSDVSDSTRKPRRRIASLGRRAAALSDLVVFLGEHSHHGVRGAVEAGMPQENAHHFYALQPAAQFLRQELKDGDLVLLKGLGTEHHSRLLFAQVGPVRCWKPICGKTFLCDICWELGSPSAARDKLTPL